MPSASITCCRRMAVRGHAYARVHPTTLVSSTCVLSGQPLRHRECHAGGRRRLVERCHADRRARILHDLDVFADQRADLQVLGLEPIEAARIDRHRRRN